MEYAETYKALDGFIRDKVLGGEDVAIDEDTPLLEWGILTSLTTTELLAYVQSNFGITIPVDRMFGANFKDLRSITQLLVDLSGDTHPEMNPRTLEQHQTTSRP